jgi:hypothetical protein
MRRSSVGVALAILVLFKVPSAFADPLAQWAGPWMVTPGQRDPSTAGANELRRAFGEDAREDEEIMNVGSAFEPLPGTQAWAKVYGQSAASVCLAACLSVFGFVSIEFERTFRLQGSPSGEWAVVFVSNLIGAVDFPTIVGAGVDIDPLAIVEASVSLSAASDPDTPLHQLSFSDQLNSSTGPRSIDDFMSRTGFLPNGIYLVRGSLFIQTEIEESRFTSPTITADFLFGELSGLRVGVAVAPRVTEQSIIISSVYQSLLHRSPTDEEIVSSLAYLRAGGTREGLRGRLLAKLVPAL